MGFFDFLFGKKKTLSSDALRVLLFDAVAAEDAAAIAKLCAEHEALILESFPAWQKIPEEFRSPDKLRWYGPGLIHVAQHFAAERGKPQLLNALSGGARENPLSRWQQELGEANQEMEDGEFGEALERLRTLLEQVRKLQGPGADKLMPVTLGLVGRCLFELGQEEDAIAPNLEALAFCESSGDQEAAIGHWINLYDLYRYTGQTAQAAAMADRVAAALGDSDDGARWRVMAGIVRAGEPLCRVLIRAGDRVWELADYASGAGAARFEFARNRPDKISAHQRIDAGIACGMNDDLPGAMALFQQAAQLDPYNPRPHLHAGMTALYQRDYEGGLRAFQAAEALAPGYMQVRNDLWLAEQMKAGTIDHGLFLLLRELLDGEPTPEEAVALARAGLERQKLGLLYLNLGNALMKQQQRAEAEAAYRQGLAIAEEPDVRTRLLVGLGTAAEESRARREALNEARALNGNLVAAAMATVVLAHMPPGEGVVH